jgi:hypothetical protein
MDEDTSNKEALPVGERSEETGEAIGRLIDSLVDTFVDEPGFMWTGSGIEVLHADWPAYPTGHGPRRTLARLGEFPADTTFFAVDRIDGCTLFVAGRELPRDPLNRKHYHVAVWDEDLRACQQRGFLVGPSIGSDGRIEFPAQQMAVSSRGQYAILIDELTHDINQSLLQEVQDFFYLKRFDAGIREAALFLEATLRTSVGSTESGQALIEECFGESGRLFPSVV